MSLLSLMLLLPRSNPAVTLTRKVLSKLRTSTRNLHRLCLTCLCLRAPVAAQAFVKQQRKKKLQRAPRIVSFYYLTVARRSRVVGSSTARRNFSHMPLQSHQPHATSATSATCYFSQMPLQPHISHFIHMPFQPHPQLQPHATSATSTASATSATCHMPHQPHATSATSATCHFSHMPLQPHISHFIHVRVARASSFRAISSSCWMMMASKGSATRSATQLAAMAA